jgi:hypothetical protein
MIHITKLEKTLESRLGAELVSSCGILGICISYKSKHIDAFKSEAEYMFHSWGNNEDGIDIFWGHYDLKLSEALAIWKDKINQNPAGKRW